MRRVLQFAFRLVRASPSRTRLQPEVHAIAEKPDTIDRAECVLQLLVKGL